MDLLREPQLPFKIKRKGIPKLIKRGKAYTKARYNEANQTIIAHKKLTKYEYAHELAHHQLGDIPDNMNSMVRGEIKADLVTYIRMKKPVEYYDRLQMLLRQVLRHTHKLKDEGGRYRVSNPDNIIASIGVIETEVSRYYDYFPKRWQNDWHGFDKYWERRLGYRIKELQAK